MEKETEVSRLVAEKEDLLAKLSCLGNMVHGSCFSRYLVCSRPGCKCHSGEKHGPVMCFSVVQDGRKRQQYVPKSLEVQAVAAVDAYNEALAIIDRVSEINLLLFKAQAPGRRGKRSLESASETGK